LKEELVFSGFDVAGGAGPSVGFPVHVFPKVRPHVRVGQDWFTGEETLFSMGRADIQCETGYRDDHLLTHVSFTHSSIRRVSTCTPTSWAPPPPAARVVVLLLNSGSGSV
jgi:hypothetical protein